MSATSFTNGDLFSCKISLKDSRPPVWRRVLVPVDYTFKDLHDVILAVMEWDDSHCHRFSFKHPLSRQEFEINGPGVDNFDDGFDNVCNLPENTKISPYVIRLKQKIGYEYDFGCSFEHVIEFEKIIDAPRSVSYPKCMTGKGMPPPEDDPDGKRSEVFDQKRMDSNLSRCRQFVKRSDEVNSVSEKQSSTTRANQSIALEEPNAPPAKKRVIGTGQPSASSTIPVEINLQKDKAVDLNTDKNSSSASADKSTEVEPLQGPPSKILSDDSALASSSTLVGVATIPSVYANAINYSPRKSDELTSRCRRCEENENMDYDDFYGKYVADNLKLVADGEMRANLRYDIQLAIKKYSEFQKPT